MSGIVNLSRRDFLRDTGVLVIGLSLAPGRALADVTAAGVKVGDAVLAPGVFVSLAADGAVTVVCHRSEMGQQVRTSMAQIVADELDADWSRVHVAQATGHPKYGDQNTDGSRSVRRNFTRLRQAGASVRMMLEQAAAETWGVAAEECRARNHAVVHAASGRELDYGALAEAAAALSPPEAESLRLKQRSEWRYIGKAVSSVDLPAIVRGAGTFGIDVQMDDLLVAVIARPPVLFGVPESVDDKAALKIPGVVRIVRLPDLTPPAVFKPLGGVAVVARDSWSAIQGRDALKIKWRHGDNASYDSQSYAHKLVATARAPCEVVREHGDVDAALAGAAKTVTAEYYAPHLSQAPMEPPCATAVVGEGRCEIWASTQTPQSTRSAVAAALQLDEDQVTVNVTLLGGAFGRKSKPDFSVEAALVARAAGAPVKVMWTREDDLRHGYYHSVSAQRIDAALDEHGKTTAWRHRTVFPSISSTFDGKANKPADGELRLGFVDNPFAIDNMRLERGEAQAHIRIGWLRSVANVYHAFAVQSFAHELALAAGRDPKDYLLELIGPPRLVGLEDAKIEYDNYGDPIDVYPIDTGRLAHVTRKAADMAGWGRRLKKGHGLGIAAHRSFLSYVATVVEVRVGEDRSLSIPHVWLAIDAGTVVNTDHVRAQCEGGSVYGLSAALTSEISVRNGAVEQSNFHDYQVARMSQAPNQIDVHIVPSEAPPAGVGEPPTPPFAPALCNAIADASGKRIRRLPIRRL